MTAATEIDGRILAAARKVNKSCCRDAIPNYQPVREGWKIPKSAEDSTSEYQAAYRRWSFQPKRTPIRPSRNRPNAAAAMDIQSIYRKDFISHQTQKKDDCEKKKVERRPPIPETPMVFTKTTYAMDFSPKKCIKSESYKPVNNHSERPTKFSGRSMYQTSYETYDLEIAKQCRPKTVKPSECLAEQAAEEPKQTETSTVQNDFQKHENVERRMPIKPEENTKLSEEQLDTTTVYSETYNEKPLAPRPLGVNKNKPMAKVNPFYGITTVMADFPPHDNVSRRPCCRPPPSHHFSDAPFDGRTTQSMAYKAWAVSVPERPLWARKPEYKPPTIGVSVHTTYKYDFKNPDVKDAKVRPFRPDKKADIIKHGSGDGTQFLGTTTYQENYTEFQEARPATSYRITQRYEPPKEKMEFESTNRMHFKGEQVRRAELCRHVSEHRELNLNKTMEFSTTYMDTFKPPEVGLVRPQSCPGAIGRSRPGQAESPKSGRWIISGDVSANISSGSTKDSEIGNITTPKEKSNRTAEVSVSSKLNPSPKETPQTTPSVVVAEKPNSQTVSASQ